MSFIVIDPCYDYVQSRHLQQPAGVGPLPQAQLLRRRSLGRHGVRASAAFVTSAATDAAAATVAGVVDASSVTASRPLLSLLNT